MADLTILSGGGAKPNTRMNTFRAGNIADDISVEPGDPVVILDEVDWCDATARATSNCAGLAVSSGERQTDGTPGGFIDIQYAGPCTLTTDQWDRVTGGTGGLTPHSTYYLSATRGKLTTSVLESPDYVAPIGFALTATTMMIQIPGDPQLGGVS